MTTYIALLRGVNVGGRKRVKMESLRELLRSLGHTDVATYLQSGNALFTSGRADVVHLEREIEEQIASRLELEVKVLVRTRQELASVVDANPLPAATSEPSRFHIAFLAATPRPDAPSALESSALQSEVVRLGDRVMYIWYRNGFAVSKLTNALLERRLGVSATSRNWNTVTKLLGLASQGLGDGLASDRAEAIRNAHDWFEVNSGWAPPEEDELAEWVADGVCRCPDDCLVQPESWCSHGLASWLLILRELDAGR